MNRDDGPDSIADETIRLVAAGGTVPTSQEHRARMVLTAACARVGLDPRGATLIRLVGNAVFRLARHPVVVKIVLTPRLRHRAENAVAAARLFARHDIPVIRPWEHVPQPVHIRQYAMTFWHLVPDSGRRATGIDLARLLRRLHRIPAVGLPDWEPIGDLRVRIAHAERVDSDDLRFLRGRCDQVARRLAALRQPLPRAIIHGDARVGNLIAGPDGFVFCDLDTTGIGPATWDLVPTAVAALRFPDAMPTHRELVRAHGFDVTAWDGFEVLREIRELKLVTAALPTAATNPLVAGEFHRRLHTYRRGDRTATWTRYR